jgi:hypothetical protein
MGRISDLDILLRGYGFLWIPCVIGFIISLKHALKTKQRMYLLPVSWLLFAIIMTQPLLSGYGYRLMLISFFPVMILIGICLDEIKARLKTMAFIVALTLVFIAAFVPFWHLGTTMRPLIREEEVPIFMELKESVPEDSIIIMPHWGIRYWTEYLTGLEVELRLTPEIIGSGRPIYAFVERRSMGKLGPGFEFVWRRGRFSLYKFVGRRPPGFGGTLSLEGLSDPEEPSNKSPNDIREEFQKDFPGRKILDARDFRGDFFRMYIQARQENALVIVPKEVFKMEKALQDLFTVYAEKRNFLLLEPRLDIKPPRPPPRPPGGIVSLADVAVMVFTFPAQAFNYLDIPMKAVIKASIGLPLTFLFWGFILGMLKLAFHRRKWTKLREILRRPV